LLAGIYSNNPAGIPCSLWFCRRDRESEGPAGLPQGIHGRDVPESEVDLPVPPDASAADHQGLMYATRQEAFMSISTPPLAPVRATKVNEDLDCRGGRATYDLPFNDRARAQILANILPPAKSARDLLSVKTGGCPEDCAYCPQAARYRTRSGGNYCRWRKLSPLPGGEAKRRNAFCMGAAWRERSARYRSQAMVSAVRPRLETVPLWACGDRRRASSSGRT
jgi:hypothetical protein